MPPMPHSHCAKHARWINSFNPRTTQGGRKYWGSHLIDEETKTQHFHSCPHKPAVQIQGFSPWEGAGRTMRWDGSGSHHHHHHHHPLLCAHPSVDSRGGLAPCMHPGCIANATLGCMRITDVPDTVALVPRPHMSLTEQPCTCLLKSS